MGEESLLLSEECLLYETVSVIEVTSIDKISIWQGWTLGIALPVILGLGFLVVYAIFKDIKINIR